MVAQVGNLSHQINHRASLALTEAVRRGDILWLSRSAGTMMAMKSIEMSAEVSQAKLRELSVGDIAFRRTASRAGQDQGYSSEDLDGEGVAVNVLGAVPLIRTCLAMRPHFQRGRWGGEVQKENKEALLEFAAETAAAGEIDLMSFAKADSCLEDAVRLANLVSGNQTQDHPVFLPMSDGQALHLHVTRAREVFTSVGQPRTQPRGKTTRYEDALLHQSTGFLAKFETFLPPAEAAQFEAQEMKVHHKLAHRTSKRNLSVASEGRKTLGVVSRMKTLTNLTKQPSASLLPVPQACAAPLFGLSPPSELKTEAVSSSSTALGPLSEGAEAREEGSLSAGWTVSREELKPGGAMDRASSQNPPAAAGAPSVDSLVDLTPRTLMVLQPTLRATRAATEGSVRV